MQILQNANLLLQNISGKSAKLHVGDIVQVTVKERLSDQEAVVSVNGKLFTVKFEGEIPSENRISIEITGKTNEGSFLVRVSERDASETNMQQKNIQEQPKQPLTDAVKVFTDKGIVVTKENLAALKKYLNNDSGTIDQKMATLKIIADKQIPITDLSLKSVHEALHGPAISDTLFSILDKMDAPVQENMPQPNADDKISAPALSKNLANELSANQKANEDFLTTVQPANRQPIETSNPNHAEGEISPVISEMEMNTKQISETENYLINEAVQSLKVDSKNVIVTEITEKMAQMAIDFKKVRQEISRNLDTITKMVEHRHVQPANVQQIMESTIHKLDKAILQSDFLLYADMGTEKKLLSASSQLAEAKKFLEQGEYAKAHQIVKEVKANVESIIFKPSDVKIKHMITDKFPIESQSSTKQVANLIHQTVQPFTETGSISRTVYEMVRKLGLTHETETAVTLMTKSGHQEPNQNNENLKAALLRLIRSEDVKPHLQQQAEQAVQHITGQQLLNKPDSSGLQNLFFQIPYLLDKQVENVKIYLNSRKNGEKVDWENCQLIFSLETKKLGEIGVVLTAANRKVGLSFKSDKEELQRIVSDMTEVTKERFADIGYQLNAIGVKPAELIEENRAAKAIVKPESREALQKEKGFDFSI
ncbi:hypothetical protein [Peribacillus huizhouensis]|uniref:Amino acid-binding ACT domain protein n=1 Tax=Peribacillus huizhouensis TaxID=1501239 RepID=A0ABR6CQ12_9BACI|nr:hypothetical protein [Peribacillus huizhouensis]MBA9026743.1 putative amino acid-binding ACT domain protein [Peribacillus huizhouensis]